MPTRNISLTDHFDRFVEESVRSGRYLNASEVVRDGLRLLEGKQEEQRLKLDRLREAAAAGFVAIDRGEFREIAPGRIGQAIAAIGKRAARQTRAARK